jgi:hypothetical protein
MISGKTTKRAKKELYNSLGHLTMAFSDLEGALNDFICCLISEDECIGGIIVSSLTFAKKRQIASSLFNHIIRDKKLTESFDKISKNAQNAADARNMIVHSSWGIWSIDDDNNFILSREKGSYKGGHPKHKIEASVDEIFNVAGICEKAHSCLIDFMIDLHKKNIVKFYGPVEMAE